MRKDDKMKTVEYKVSGMTCMGCAQSVERVLKRNQGVESVKVKHLENQVFVTYDETQVQDETLLKQINRIGFKAELAS